MTNLKIIDRPYIELKKLGKNRKLKEKGLEGRGWGWGGGCRVPYFRCFAKTPTFVKTYFQYLQWHLGK